MKNICLHMGFVYHRAQFNWVSLNVTLNWIGVENSGLQFRLCVTPALDPAEYMVGVFPWANWLTLAVDRSRLSRNIMLWIGTAVTAPLLGKRTDVYSWLYDVEFFWRHSEKFSFVKTCFVAYDTRIFQYSVHNSKPLVAMASQKNAVHTSTQKSVVGKCICEVGRQELTENWYALWSTYRVCALVRLELYIFVNISGVPSNNAKPKLDGRIEGGSPAQIEQHPHQVKLLNLCSTELFLSCIEI
jgi:hypothetical protein